MTDRNVSAYTHRRQRRKDDPDWRSKSSHHPHPKHDCHGCQHSDQRIVQIGFYSRCLRKCFIECDRKYFIIKKKIQNENDSRQNNTQPNIFGAHSQNTAEHIIVHICIHSVVAEITMTPRAREVVEISAIAASFFDLAISLYP